MEWSAIQAHYGNIASVLGLVVSIVGFLFTLRQVRKSRTAAEKAQVMAREAVERVSSRLFFTQVTTAIRLVHELRTFCRGKDWRRALDRCEDLRIGLAILVDDSKLRDVERETITTALDDILLMMKLVEGIHQEKRSPLVPPRMLANLDEVMVSLTRIDTRLKASLLEV